MSYLQRPSSTDNWLSDLSDGAGNQKASKNDSNNWSKRKNGLNEIWEELVGGHTYGNRSQDNLQIKAGEKGRTRDCKSIIYVKKEHYFNPKLTWIVDFNIPAVLTGTTAPRMDLHKKGIITVAPNVVAAVMSTEKAVFPRAM